ncbi:MAG: patatin family protein [Firmicutes bacterium]|nr:patatin family protein [Bacillota bacterium]
MKKGLIMEGGAMRGIFTCGVIDVFLENNIEFDGAIGVSAGAAFGCNYKSRQIGRAFRYNSKYCNDKRYSSIWSLITTGDLYNAKFCYEDLIYRLDPWDREAYVKNPMEFHCVVSNVETGKAEYHNCVNGDEEDILWIRASASIPVFSRPVEIHGKKYLDGGSTDSIPLEYFESIGYDRNVVIETQPIEYRKEKQKFLGLIRIVLHKYPNLVHALSIRYKMYNHEKEYIHQKEQQGSVYVIRPESSLNIKSNTKDSNELKRVYELGRMAGLKHLENVKKFLQE